jgi:DNA-directed RNA polymerase subunit RPC12/RpoP
VEGEASGPPGVGMSLLFGALPPSIAPPPVTPGQASALELAATVKRAIKEPRINVLMIGLPRGPVLPGCRRKICAARPAGPRSCVTEDAGTDVAGHMLEDGMSSAATVSCPRCGSSELELETASLNGETADETTVQTCRRCGYRFSITAKRD